MVGMIATGIFATEKGLITGQTATFFAHLVALVIVAAYTFVGSFILFKITDMLIPLRVTEEQEVIGLDLSQHGETALGADLFGTPRSNGEPAGQPLVGSHS
jgi:Amt family ammonium transporter